MEKDRRTRRLSGSAELKVLPQCCRMFGLFFNVVRSVSFIGGYARVCNAERLHPVKRRILNHTFIQFERGLQDLVIGGHAIYRTPNQHHQYLIIKTCIIHIKMKKEKWDIMRG